MKARLSIDIKNKRLIIKKTECNNK